MSACQIRLISEGVVEEARRSRRSPGYGHPLQEDTATGYGPCRECLRVVREGRERRLLLTCDAFHGIDSHAQVETGGDDTRLMERLARPGVDYVPASDPGAGCFTFNVVGGPDPVRECR